MLEIGCFPDPPKRPERGVRAMLDVRTGYVVGNCGLCHGSFGGGETSETFILYRDGTRGAPTFTAFAHPTCWAQREGTC